MESVEAMVARVLGIPLGEVNDDLRYHSRREWDSQGHVELMLALEERLGTLLDESNDADLVSMPALRAFCAKMAENGQPAAEPSCALEAHSPPAPNQTTAPTLMRGLSGVYVDATEISRIDGQAGTLEYRGYPIQDLAANATFEETVWLLWHGELPTRSQLVAFDTELKAARQVPPPVLDLLATLCHAHPVDALRTGVSMLATYDPDRHDNSEEATLRKATRLLASAPTQVAAHHAFRSGQTPVPPDATLSHAANFLAMLRRATPEAEEAALLDKDLILHAEHGSNASAFAARVVIGTEADLHAAMTAAIAAFSGPRHGGAPENVAQMAREVGTPDRAAAYVRQRRAEGQPIMGFGHRVYRAPDPRALYFRCLIETYQAERAAPSWYAVLRAVEAEMTPFARHGIHVNVDFYVGILYELLALPADLAVPIFILGRMAGWTAHILEQQRNNILIRPLLHSVGPEGRAYHPLSEREETTAF
jgi:citrate synthase